MKYTVLTGTDLKVSKVCIGCMGFGKTADQDGWTLDYEQTKDILTKALDAGINFFDTAMGYSMGNSEIFLGRVLKETGKRKDCVIATKYVPRNPDQIAAGITGEQHIRTCVENSLKRLDTDYIDLYYLHMWDFNTPVEETLRTLDEYVKAGKIRYLAISNCYAWQLAQTNEIAKANGWTPFSVIQGHYNLLFREEEREMAGYCAANGVSMVPYSALAAGRLSRRPGETSARLEKDAFAKLKYDAAAEMDNVIIERVAELAEKHHVSMTAVSLYWLMQKTAAPIAGVTKPHHLKGIEEAMELELSEEEMHYLEELYQPHPLAGVMAMNSAKSGPVTHTQR